MMPQSKKKQRERQKARNAEKKKLRKLGQLGTAGICRDCGSKTTGIEGRDWYHASKPRCSKCGGQLDRIGSVKNTGRRPIRSNTYMVSFSGTRPEKPKQHAVFKQELPTE